MKATTTKTTTKTTTLADITSAHNFKDKASARAHADAKTKALKVQGFKYVDTDRNTDETGSTTAKYFEHPNGQAAEVFTYHDSGNGHPGRGGSGRQSSRVETTVWNLSKPTKTSPKQLEIVVTERRRYLVPELLATHVRQELRQAKRDGTVTTDYLEELISTMDTREGAEEITTVAVKVAR